MSGCLRAARGCRLDRKVSPLSEITPPGRINPGLSWSLVSLRSRFRSVRRAAHSGSTGTGGIRPSAAVGAATAKRSRCLDLVNHPDPRCLPCFECSRIARGCRSDREIHPLSKPLPHPKKSILSHPGASFPCGSASIRQPRRIFRRLAARREPAGPPCIRVSEGRQGMPAGSGGCTLSEPSPRPEESTLGRPGASFPAIPLQVCPLLRRMFRRGPAGFALVLGLRRREIRT